MTLEELQEEIQPADQDVVRLSKERWMKIGKPLFSLGKLEQQITRIAGIKRIACYEIKKKALVVMCADNGVVAEGVTQTGQEVTAAVVSNMTRGRSCSCLMAEKAETEVFPIDMGIACEVEHRGELHPLTERKIRRGTSNFTKAAAMTRQEVLTAILTGIDAVRVLKEQGYRLSAVGEMGIGNTTTSSAVASVLLNRPAEEMTGRGAGLSGDGLDRKIHAIKKAIAVNRPDPKDAIDVLAKVGGFDIAGMAGMFLGGAALGVPVVIDGFISCVAALIAQRICPQAGDYMIASHVSKEPAAHLILEALGKEAVLHGEMCLGEGSGAVALFPFLDMGVAVYESMSTFEDIHVEQYKELV